MSDRNAELAKEQDKSFAIPANGSSVWVKKILNCQIA